MSQIDHHNLVSLGILPNFLDNDSLGKRLEHIKSVYLSRNKLAEENEEDGLEERLHGSNKTKVLTWADRFKVIKQIASALQYLHHNFEKPIAHGNIKPSSIFLDNDSNVKLGDYGILTDMDGTRVLDPETDVMEYGFLVLEIISGKKLDYPQKEIQRLREYWANGYPKKQLIEEVIDYKLGGDFNGKEVELVLNMALRCSKDASDHGRPSMDQVVKWLDSSMHGTASSNTTSYYSTAGI